tara:strand:+ start:837 stop:1133 length:297 start_codon:yes stop_codon:yes gene_type:complete
MSEFWKAQKEFKSTPAKKHYLTFNKEEIEVSLQQYLEVTNAGIENFEYKDKKIVRKKRVPVEQRQPTLHSADVGYHFYNGDPFWVEKHNRGGFEWRIE